MGRFTGGFLAGVVVSLAAVWFWRAPAPGEAVAVMAAAGAPDTVRIITRAADSTLADSLRAEISRLQKRLLRSMRAIRPVVTVLDTVIDVIDVADAVPDGRVVMYESRMTFRREYLTATVEALALAPVDSFRLRGTVDFERWHRERRLAGERRQLWTERALWAAAVALVYLSGKK